MVILSMVSVMVAVLLIFAKRNPLRDWYAEWQLREDYYSIDSEKHCGE